MKKLLLMLFAILALTPQNSQAQTDTTKVATIETMNEKLDAFLKEQQSTNEILENKINRVNQRLQAMQNQSSLRWLLRDTIPIVILIIIGGVIIAIVYLISMSGYRNRKIKYETIIKCTELTGQTPDLISFNQDNNVQNKRVAIQPEARIYLFLSIVCGIITFFMFVVALNVYGVEKYMCGLFSMMSIIATGLLFNQFNIRNRENNRTNQQ